MKEREVHIVQEAIYGPTKIPPVFEKELERIDAKIASTRVLGISTEKEERTDQNGVVYHRKLDMLMNKAYFGCKCGGCKKAFLNEYKKQRIIQEQGEVHDDIERHTKSLPKPKDEGDDAITA